MSSYPNPLYDPRRRRRRHQYGGTSQHHHSPLTTIATTAAVAYGAYKVGSWIWNSYLFGNEEDCTDDDNTNNYNKDDNGDLLYEWTADYRNGKEGSTYDLDDYKSKSISNEGTSNNAEEEEIADSARMKKRSPRRTRVDFSNEHKNRSHRPSPPQDYHQHFDSSRFAEDEVLGGNNSDDGKKQNGGSNIKLGVKMAASGLGSAVGAGISAGIHAYNTKNSIPLPEQELVVHMGRCRLETSHAMMDFLPTLKRAIVKETDVSDETEELKQLRIKRKDILDMKQEQQSGETNNIMSNEEIQDEEDIIREKERCLWNSIKNKSLTRLMTTIYAHTIIFLVLNVQVNLLGGRLLREELEEENESSQPQSTSSSAADRYRTSHQTVLSKTYHYLFAKGIPALATSLGKEVEDILQKFDVLGDNATLADVSSWIECIRDKMEHRNEKEGENQIMSQLVKFVIPQEGDVDASSNNADNEASDELAKYILDETYDLLESPSFVNAEKQCLDTTFDQLRMKVLGRLFLMEDSVPLANVVTHLQKNAVSTFHKPPSHKEEMKSWGGILGMMEEPLPSVPNDYISKLERLEAVHELCDVCF